MVGIYRILNTPFELIRKADIFNVNIYYQLLQGFGFNSLEIIWYVPFPSYP